MDVCSSYKYGNDIELERLSYRSKIISINIRISLLLSREKVNMTDFSFSRLAALVCFLAAVPFVSFPILFQQLQEKNEQQKNLSPLGAQCETLGFMEDYWRKFHQEVNGSKLSKR